MLGLLQVVLIRPYYRDNRMKMAQNLSSTIESTLLNNKADENDVSRVFDFVVNNDACVAIYNSDGKRLYYGDAIGEACMFDQNIKINNMDVNIKSNPEILISMLDENISLESVVKSSVTGYDMLVYANLIKSNLANYYLVINSPLEPVESVIDFILQQFLFIAIIVFFIAFVVALFLADKLSFPILKMRKETLKLQKGNYNVEFTSKDNAFSEIEDLAQALDSAALELSKIDELRKDLLANVSHDIKTPLTMIQAYAEMIEDISGDDPIKRKEHLDIILKETEYLNKLVTDMQELSKMQAGCLELKKTNFDLKCAVEDIVDLLDALFKQHQLKLHLNLDECIVYGDEMKLSQVIYNFTSNAIKHSADAKNIYINIFNKEDLIRFEIKDEGEGISEEELPYIWDRYYKIDKGFRRKMGSTGLGLAIAKAILEAHHATFGVESKLNEGTMFYFELSKEYEEDED